MRPVVKHVLGRILRLEGIILFLPLLISVIYGEPLRFILSYGLTAIGAILLGTLLKGKKPEDDRFYAKDGFMLVSLAWILLSLVGAVPFFASGEYPNFIDAFFETVSGFTTTGSTVNSAVESAKHSTLFWRSLTQFLGGMGVLVFALAIFPTVSAEGTVYLAMAEMPGPSFSKITARLSKVAQILYGIYAAMTLILFILLWAFGMTPFDAICHAFTTAGTGGFSTKNNSIAYFDSPQIEITLGVFMLLYSVNFNLYYLLLIGEAREASKNEELRWFAAFFGGAWLLIFLNAYHAGTADISAGEGARHAFFTVSSLMSSTGFSVVNHDLWPLFSRLILFTAMFIGACAGSTGGGLKVSRIAVMLKAIAVEFKKIRHPNRVVILRFEGEEVEDDRVRSILIYFAIFILLLGVSVVLISLDGLDFYSAFGNVLTCINNIGANFGRLNAEGSFQSLHGASKLLLSFDMIAGRLEFWPVLLLLSPKTWRMT